MAAFEPLLQNGSTSDEFLSFHEDYWGKPLPQEHVTLEAYVEDAPDDDENDGDLLPDQSNPFLRSALKNLLIRSEYLRIYEYVEKAYELHTYKLQKKHHTVI